MVEPERVIIPLVNKILYGPYKAAKAGGISASALEKSQKSQRMSWAREEVEGYLKRIMHNSNQSHVDAA